MQMCKAFAAICDYLLALGLENISKCHGLCERQVDEHWWIAVNPHDEDLPCSKGSIVPSFHCLVEFDDRAAGIIGMHGGTMPTNAVVANEKAFIQALEEASRKVA